MTDGSRDTSRRWGFMEDDVFVPLPKQPMLNHDLGPPPFDVRLPTGVVRHVIEEPSDG